MQKTQKINLKIQEIENLSNELYEILGRNTMVFIKQEDYLKLPKNITEEIDNTKIEDFLGPEAKYKLKDLYTTKICFVKYNSEVEIEQVQELSEQYIRTTDLESSYAILTF